MVSEPRAIAALRRSLAGATEAGLRDRLIGAIDRLERLYGLAKPPDTRFRRRAELDDMRRRKFVRQQHRLDPDRFLP